MKKTFKEILEINNVIQVLIKANKDISKTKFGYAIDKFIKSSISEPMESFNEALTKIRVENALVDEKTKAILTDLNPHSRGFQFSREGLMACMEGESALVKEWSSKEFEVTPFICTSDLPAITEQQKEILLGVII
jgi:hypothetical protein